MERDGKQRKLTGVLAALGRYKYALLVAALGAVLLLWPQERAPTGGESVSGGSSAAALAETERAMEDILGKIQGVGQVDVMLTLHSGSELVLAADTQLRYSGNTAAPDDYDRSSRTVTVSGGGSGGDVVVTQERFPQYRGALVVCQGGGRDGVRLQVAQAVSALTGLGMDRISVVERQPSGGGTGGAA